MRQKPAQSERRRGPFLPLSIVLIFCVFGTIVYGVAQKTSREMSSSAIQNLSESLDLIQCTIEAILSNEAEFQSLLAQELADAENNDIVLLEDGAVDVGDLARTAMILEMDAKTLCSEDCRGLCPGCGVNLNQGSCTCRKEADPRLAVLASLLKKDTDS